MLFKSAKGPLLSLPLLLSMLVSGCNDDDKVEESGATKTEEIVADIIALPDRDGVNVEVRMKNTSGRTVRLTDGDKLWATILKDPNKFNFEDDLFNQMVNYTDANKELGEGRSGDHDILGLPLVPADDFWYSTQFASPPDDTVYTVRLERGSETDAPGSTISLPPRFSIDSPAPNDGALYSRTLDNITLNWSPAAGDTKMLIKARTECDNLGTKTWSLEQPQDSGSATIAAASLSDAAITGSCPIRITFQRVISGTLDPAFNQNGRIEGRRSDNVVIDTTD